MPIRPIEIMRSQEVTQLKHLESHKNQQEQVQIGKSFQNMIVAENQRPNETVKSENKEFRYDAKEKGQNNYNGSKDKKRENTEEDKKDQKKSNTAKERSGGIDILI